MGNEDIALFYMLDRYEVETQRIQNYIYMLQKVGYNFNFNYQLGVSGVFSKYMTRYLDELEANGFIDISYNIVHTTYFSDDILNETPGLLSFWNNIERVCSLLGTLSDDYLSLLILTDYMFNEVKETYPNDELQEHIDSIERTFKSYYQTYERSDLNKVLKVLLKINKLKEK